MIVVAIMVAITVVPAMMAVGTIGINRASAQSATGHCQKGDGEDRATKFSSHGFLLRCTGNPCAALSIPFAAEARAIPGPVQIPWIRHKAGFDCGAAVAIACSQIPLDRKGALRL
ncbi:MAG: hypothetical protein ABI439_01245 [Rhodospirillales bacterium]